jgi:8-oxo-dGTP pyrophosphatase MutT (NUDIX family)
MLHAAVVIPIVRYPEPAIVFVLRAAHLRRNPGQVAFPGGVVDEADGEDPVTTALREFEEELGVPRERLTIVERLESVVTLSLNVSVTPFLGVLDPPVIYQPDEAETAGVHEVPLAMLYAPGALHEGTETVERDGRTYHVATWLFDHEGLHVWGATGRMLHNLVTRYPSIVTLPLPRKG